MHVHIGLKVRTSLLNQLSDNLELEAASRVITRRCVVTGEYYNRDDLLRFAISPDNKIVFDVKKNLPGRGIWIYPKIEHVEQAVKKRIFSNAAKKAANAPDDLADKVAYALKQRMLNLLQRGQQSREMVNGFEKVSSALRAEETRLLIHASDAKADGVTKLNKLAADNVIILQPATRDEISDAIGVANPVHLSMRSAGLSKAFIAAYALWTGFMNKDAL